MGKWSVAGLVALVLSLGAGSSTAGAAAVISQAAGADAAAITATQQQFRDDLGTANGTNPPQPSGRRQIAWDGVPDQRAAPSFMPENQFRNVGALFSTPGLGFQVSMDDDTGTDPDPDQLDFSDINSTYATAFAPFSPPRLFTASGSNVTDTTFVLPGSTTRAQTNGFGVIFSDVDVEGSTKLELFEADGDSLGSWTVPAAGNLDESFSFLGVRFDAGERAALARITSGAAAPSGPSPAGDDVTQLGPADIVVMDDFIFGEPQAVPAPAPAPPPPPPTPPVVDDDTAPGVTLRGAPAAIRLRALLAGLRLRLTPNEPASFRVTLLGSVGDVRLARYELTLTRRTLRRAAGARSLRIRPTRRLLRNAPRRFRVQLVVEATDAARNTRTLRRTIRVRR